jgi:hypothetical protein
LPNIRHEASPGGLFQHSQTANNRQACVSRNATRFSFIQKDKVGWQTLGQKDGAALARPEALACVLQQKVRRRSLRYYLNPDGVTHSLGSGKTTATHGYLMVDFGGN